MKPPDAAPPAKVVSALDTEENSKTGLPALAPRRAIGFPVSVVEFLLLFRLRVRRRSMLSADMLERAFHVVVVTCKNWFSRAAEQPKSSAAGRR